MIGIIFAAGIGSRLKPFTDSHPKALAPVAGVPAIVRVARRMVAAGVRAIVVNVHHFPQQVVDCLMAQPFANIIEISDESGRLLDTGGALAKIWRQSTVMQTVELHEPIIVHNADIATDFPIAEMVQFLGTADAAILVDPRRASSRRFLFDDTDMLRGWTNIDKGIVRPAGLNAALYTPAAFGGVHMLTPHIMADIARSVPVVIAPFSITDWYISHCNTQCIKGYTPTAPFRWYDIGTIEKLATANAAFFKD